MRTKSLTPAAILARYLTAFERSTKLTYRASDAHLNRVCAPLQKAEQQLRRMILDRCGEPALGQAVAVKIGNHLVMLSQPLDTPGDHHFTVLPCAAIAKP